jgi:radical SAM protein with 4Fe4S-binding SPASM domain
LVDNLRRSAHLGLAVIKATVGRPAAPLKLNFCLTYWCQYRCKTCNIWQRKPTDELTTDEVLTFVRENPHITWADLTGGEIFLRPDIDEIFDAIVSGWNRLAILHFPTNGFLTDRIVKSVERLARRRTAGTIVTVSLDGDERLNDEVRGIKGGFKRQIETFKALRRIPGLQVVFGVTLSSYNAGQFSQTFDACARECPGLSIHDVHLNIAQVSDHYYGNDGRATFVPDQATARTELRGYQARRGHARSPQQLLENTYLKYLDRFLETRQTPMPCHSLRASCFVDPWGVVYPCITYSRPIGRLRDTGMRLDSIWNARETAQLQKEIWEGQCPQCWTACEAYQSILGNVLAARFHAPRASAPRSAQPVSPNSELVR